MSESKICVFVDQVGGHPFLTLTLTQPFLIPSISVRTPYSTPLHTSPSHLTLSTHPHTLQHTMAPVIFQDKDSKGRDHAKFVGTTLLTQKQVLMVWCVGVMCCVACVACVVV